LHFNFKLIIVVKITQHCEIAPCINVLYRNHLTV